MHYTGAVSGVLILVGQHSAVVSTEAAKDDSSEDSNDSPEEYFYLPDSDALPVSTEEEQE